MEATTALVAEPLRRDSGSMTGYAGGTRQLIVPEHNNDSYHWIAQTQRMIARGEWRLRRVEYDNAPFGRAVATTSPYRWWLGGVAWLDHIILGDPIGAAVERAAIFADPLLLVLLLLASAAFVGWQFGIFPAALFSAAMAGMFPFAGAFVPGAPDDEGLALACVVISGLPLLAGLRDVSGRDTAAGIRRTEHWFLLAGILGGVGLWVSVTMEFPVIIGLALGGIIASWAARQNGAAGRLDFPEPQAWAAWSLGGAGTVLALYLAEFFPDHLASWQLKVIHPLYGIAWLGLAAVCGQVAAWIRRGGSAWNFRGVLLLVLGLVAMAALPIIMWKTKNEGFLAIGLSSFRLTKLPGGVVASSFWSWMIHAGITAKLWTTILPAILIFPTTWLVWRKSTASCHRATVAVLLGPAFIAVGLAAWHLNVWSLFDALWLTLLVAAIAATRSAHGMTLGARSGWVGFIVVILTAGAVQLRPLRDDDGKLSLNEPEVIGLIERDLAGWLAKHSGVEGAIVLAPPKETATLYYYGGLHGLGTLAWENEAGIAAAVRIVSASTPEEARELVDRRGVKYFVIPSWDTYLDEYARIGMGQLEGTFLNRLKLWTLPPWLKPVAYQLPTLTGFEGQSVTILEVVDDQENAAALSRIGEYFVEMRRLDLAGSVAQSLRRYPADVGALVAKAQIELARDQQDEFSHSIEQLKSRLKGRNDRNLPWDRRVSLAVVLARAKERDLALAQVQRCLKDIDEPKLRMLSTGELYRLQVLAKAFGLSFGDSHLHELALGLLPADMRDRLRE